MTGRVPHPEIVRQLVFYEAGLLPEDESNAMTEHLETCEACADYVREAMAAAQEDDVRHIPAALLARWPEWSPALTGLPRLVVRHHLLHCQSCRYELETLGFEAQLPEIPELELDESARSRFEALRDRSASAAEYGAEAETRDSRGHALLQKLRESLGTLLPRPNVAFIPTLTLHHVRDPVPTRIEVEPATTAIALPISIPASLSPNDEVSVEVESPEGMSIYSRVHTAKQIAPPNVLLLSSDAPFEEGIYRVLVTAADDASRSEYRFELRYPDLG